MSKRYVNIYIDPDGVKHYPTPAIDKLTEIDAVDPDLDELVIHDQSQATGQKEKRVKPAKLWPMRARTILGRARSSGGPQVIKPEQMLATTSRAGFMSADDKAIVDALYNPNILIDGNFEYWDEGTSFTGATGYTSTMWYKSDALSTISRSTTVPNTKSEYSLRLHGNVAYIRVWHFIPSYITKQIKNQNVTLSFWVRRASTATGVARIYVRTADVKDNFSSATIRAWQEWSSAKDEWVYNALTFNLTYADVENGLVFQFYATGADVADVDYYFSQVKLEPGTVATPFYQGPEERLKVLRYFEKSYSDPAVPGANTTEGIQVVSVPASSSTTLLGASVKFLIPKRTIPTITTYRRDGSAINPTYWRLNYTTYLGVTTTPFHNSFIVGTNTASGLTAGNCYILDGHFTADARFYP